MSGSTKFAAIVRNYRKRLYPNIKSAGPLMGLSESALWRVENAIGHIPPETAYTLGKHLGGNIIDVYCAEVCVIGCERFKTCRRPELFQLAESVLKLQQSYKRISNVVLDTLPDIGADGKIKADEIARVKDCLQQLNDLEFDIECLKLRIQMELEKEKTASAKAVRTRPTQESTSISMILQEGA